MDRATFHRNGPAPDNHPEADLRTEQGRPDRQERRAILAEAIVTRFPLDPTGARDKVR